MKIQFCTSKSDFKANRVQKCMLHEILALEMTNSNPSSQVKERYYSDGDIKLMPQIPNMHHPHAYDMFSFLKDSAERFHQRKTSAQTADCSVLCANLS